MVMLLLSVRRTTHRRIVVAVEGHSPVFTPPTAILPVHLCA